MGCCIFGYAARTVYSYSLQSCQFPCGAFIAYLSSHYVRGSDVHVEGVDVPSHYLRCDISVSPSVKMMTRQTLQCRSFSDMILGIKWIMCLHHNVFMCSYESNVPAFNSPLKASLIVL